MMKAGAIISRNDGRILLAHATCKGFEPDWYDGCWGIPYGGAGWFEKPWATMARETKEEANIDVNKLKCERVFYKKDDHEKFVFHFSGGDNITDVKCNSIVPILRFPEMDAFAWHLPYEALRACEWRFCSLFKAYLGARNEWTVKDLTNNPDNGIVAPCSTLSRQSCSSMEHFPSRHLSSSGLYTASLNEPIEYPITSRQNKNFNRLSARSLGRKIGLESNQKW